MYRSTSSVVLPLIVGAVLSVVPDVADSQATQTRTGSIVMRVLGAEDNVRFFVDGKQVATQERVGHIDVTSTESFNKRFDHARVARYALLRVFDYRIVGTQRISEAKTLLSRTSRKHRTSFAYRDHPEHWSWRQPSHASSRLDSAASTSVTMASRTCGGSSCHTRTRKPGGLVEVRQ